MKKYFLIIPSFLALIFTIIIFTFVSCKEPVFYHVYMEEEPLDPLIAGPSTKFAEFNGKLFVAAGNKIFYYTSGSADTKGTWNLLYTGKSVVIRIADIAATSKYLYAAEGSKIISYKVSDSDPDLFEKTDNEITSVAGIERIYAVPGDNVLFIGALSGGSHSIYYMEDDSGPAKIITPEKFTTLPGAPSFSMLVGVVADTANNYYLCNKGDAGKKTGIFIMPKASISTAKLLPYIEKPDDPESEEKEINVNYTGIINLNGDTIAAISREYGTLYKVTPTFVAPEGHAFYPRSSADSVSTGSLCIFKDSEGNHLLLAGRQDMTNTTTSGYTHGYVEIKFDAGTGKIEKESFFIEPGRLLLSSMPQLNYEHYSTSIGKHSVKYMYQASDDILFASLNEGVWSYRVRKGKFTWNAEE